MSSPLSPKPRIIGPRTRVCIVASTYNEEYCDALVNNTIEELAELAPHARVDLIRVPGAFEIPVVVASVLEREPPSVTIALGVIIRGATQHADLVGVTVADALMRISLEHKHPVINEVLLVEDAKQAYARCMGAKLNRGREAARAAAAMGDVFNELDRTMPRPGVGKNRKDSRHG